MTLTNGAPGPARPGEDGRTAGRGTPQSGIPTQGGPGHPGPVPARPSGPFPAPFSAPPGAVPPPRPTPPAGAPAQRSPLVMGPDSGPVDDARTSLVARSEPSPGDRWKKALGAVRRPGPARWGLLGVVALVQVFVLFSAVMWWAGSSTPTATATVAPMTWTGVVYDVGAAGVNLRSAAQVRPDDARDTAARGARLALSCGQTGDVVAKGPVRTATWVKTTDGLFVSMLYVRIPDRASIPSCDGSKVDGPLLALADPANPGLPPPPGTHIAGGSGSSGTPDTQGGASASAVRGGAVAPPDQGTATVAAGSPSPVVPAAPPATAGKVGQAPLPIATSVPIGTGSGPKHHRPPPTQTTADPAAATPADPNTTPVG